LDNLTVDRLHFTREGGEKTPDSCGVKAISCKPSATGWLDIFVCRVRAGKRAELSVDSPRLVVDCMARSLERIIAHLHNLDIPDRGGLAGLQTWQDEFISQL
jgi:hypothetical protein